VDLIVASDVIYDNTNGTALRFRLQSNGPYVTCCICRCMQRGVQNRARPLASVNPLMAVCLCVCERTPAYLHLSRHLAEILSRTQEHGQDGRRGCDSSPGKNGHSCEAGEGCSSGGSREDAGGQEHGQGTFRRPKAVMLLQVCVYVVVAGMMRTAGCICNGGAPASRHRALASWRCTLRPAQYFLDIEPQTRIVALPAAGCLKHAKPTRIVRVQSRRLATASGDTQAQA